MAVVSLDSKSFGPALASPGILVIGWWAKWCAPCCILGPDLARVAGHHPDITFAAVDVEAEPELAGVLGVQTLPAWMVFRDGFLLLNHVGPVPEPMLEELVRQARALDMDDVRLEVAEYRARGTPRVRIGLHGV